MKQVDVSEPLVICAKPVGMGLLLGCAVIAVICALTVWWGVRLGDTGMVVVAGLLALLFAVLTGGLIWRRGQPNTPSLTLSQAGIEVHKGVSGIVPWPMVEGVGGLSVKGQQALIIHVDADVWTQLEQSKTFSTTRKLDQAIGVDGLTFFQQALEIPIAELVQILHAYSTAHGGRPLLTDAEAA
jgi:hypothetical protein